MFLKNFTDVLRTPILQNANRVVPLKYLLKIKIAAQDKFSEASVNRFQNRCYLKSRINDRKTPVLESLVNKVADLKRESSTSVVLGILRNSNKQLFLKNASGSSF